MKRSKHLLSAYYVPGTGTSALDVNKLFTTHHNPMRSVLLSSFQRERNGGTKN